MKSTTRVALALALAGTLAGGAAGSGGAKTKGAERWTLYADTLYTSSGQTVHNAAIAIEGGKVALIAAGRTPPEGGLHAAAVTAGLIDMSARITAGGASVEQTREVMPHVRVADTLDPYSKAWDHQLAAGVTTVLISPPDEDVISGLGIVLKTGGEPSLEARTVRADAVLRGAFGTQPSRGNHPAFSRPTDFFSRRPTTRMGVEWEWRKAFYDAAYARTDPSYAFPGCEVLQRALEGELPVFAQAWATQDIRTAVFLKEELAEEGLGELRLILDAAAEAWKEPELLVRSETAVCLPPFPPDGRTQDEALMAWNVAALLVEAGVPLALSAHGKTGPADSLAMQVAYAMRGGLAFEHALEAVTITPARLLGVDDRVGSVEVGKDADLVLWNGTPFEPTTRVVGVVLDGELAVDPRKP